jgi:signal transduction histidine kinase
LALAPGSRLARTARWRLTVLYGGLFLLLGTGLLVLVFLLTTRSSAVEVRAFPSAAGSVVRRLVAPGAVAQRSADLGRLLEVSWVVLALSTGGAVLLGWLVAGRVLAPLRAITTTARTISAGNLHQRLALTGPDDEIKRLGDTLDALLARLQGSFEAQRRFVAHASHELRTPLTVERTLLQVALANPDATVASLRAAGQELLASQAEHERLLEGLLTLASSERGIDRRTPLDLAELTRPLLPPRQRQGAGPRIEASLLPAPALGDETLVRRLIGNLIDNAVEHNRTGGRVEVSTGVEEGRARLGVANTGPSIPPEEVDRLLEPFERLEPGRTGLHGHFGLGLSIVRAIALAHDAELEAGARPDGGLAVSVRFPAPD